VPGRTRRLSRQFGSILIDIYHDLPAARDVGEIINN